MKPEDIELASRLIDALQKENGLTLMQLWAKCPMLRMPLGQNIFALNTDVDRAVFASQGNIVKLGDKYILTTDLTDAEFESVMDSLNRRAEILLRQIDDVRCVRDMMEMEIENEIETLHDL